MRQFYVLKRMVERGFTTVRDTGGATKHTAVAIEEGLIVGPRLFQCGRAISQTGGHGDFAPGRSGGSGSSLCCGGHVQPLARVADGVPDVLKAVRQELKQGADFIKIMVGGGVASETDAIDTVQYSAEEVRAITSSAWQMGKKMVCRRSDHDDHSANCRADKQCTAHAYTSEAIRHAVDNGVKGIEHGNLMDKETAEMYVNAISPLRIDCRASRNAFR
jgi:imidazolonepropionase-like amidohydrolase